MRKRKKNRSLIVVKLHFPLMTYLQPLQRSLLPRILRLKWLYGKEQATCHKLQKFFIVLTKFIFILLSLSFLHLDYKQVIICNHVFIICNLQYSTMYRTQGIERNIKIVIDLDFTCSVMNNIPTRFQYFFK